MEIPKLNDTAEKDILARIGELARAYTPEWSFSPEKPDIGVAAAQLYSGMAAGVIEKYNRTAEKNMVEFFSRLGAERFHSEPSSGFVCMRISGSETNVEGEFLNSGSELSCEGVNGETVSFTTTEPVYVLNSRITDVFCEDEAADGIYCIKENNELDSVEGITTTGDPDKDLQRHILYFVTDELDNVTGETEVLLRFELDSADSRHEAEFLSELTSAGLFYGTENGFVPVRELTCADGVLHFFLDPERLPQKTELEEINGYWFSLELKNRSNVSGIYIKGISIATQQEDIRPDAVFSDSEQLTADSFIPYSINPLPYSSVYFVCNTALCRKGSRTALEFRVDYDSNPINDPDSEDDIDWKYIMKKSRFKKPAEYDVKIRTVVWEYFNGSGWVRIFGDNSFGDVFYGENDGYTVRIEFDCPADIAPAMLPSGEVYAIRARIVSVENQYKLFGRYITPKVSSARFSYSYSKFPEMEHAVTENCMERASHDLVRGDSFRACVPLETSGKALYLGFTSPPHMAAVSLLFICPNTELVKKGGGIWEYCTPRGWSELICSDGTDGLAKTGILHIGDNPNFVRSRHFGRESCWIRIRFPDAQRFPKKQLRGIYLNAVRVRGVQYRDTEFFYVSPDEDNICRLTEGNVCEAQVLVNEAGDVTAAEAEQMVREGRAVPEYSDSGELLRLWVEWKELSSADDISRSYILDRERSEVIFGEEGGRIPSGSDSENVRISYSVSSGEAGNIPAGREFTLTGGNSGLISGAYDPAPLTGGLGRETLTRAVERAAGQLRTFSRACTENDFECLVRQAERNVLRVKCLGGRNRMGELERGAVTIVVLLRNMEAFNDSAAALKNYIASRSCANIRPEKLAVTAPTRVICGVTCELYTDSYEKVGRVKAEAEAAVMKYFDSEHGGSEMKGWEIGSLPERAAVYARIAEVAGVTSIGSFYFELFDEDGSEINDSELADIAEKGMSIPAVGRLIIYVRVDPGHG